MKRKPSRGRPQKFAKPMTGTERVRRHRERLKSAGIELVQLPVPRALLRQLQTGTPEERGKAAVLLRAIAEGAKVKRPPEQNIACRGQAQAPAPAARGSGLPLASSAAATLNGSSLTVPLTESLNAALDPLIGNQDRDKIAKAAANVIDAWATAQRERWERGDCLPGQLGGVTVTVAGTVNFDDTIFKTSIERPDIELPVYRQVGTPKSEHPPAIAVEKSVAQDHIICLDCGKRIEKDLAVHLRQKHHKLTPDGYRLRWGLPADYPMVPPQVQEFREVERSDRLSKVRI